MIINIRETSTLPPEDLDRKEAEKTIKKNVDRLGELQKILFAQKKYSVLVIFQGMDASGKDGAVGKVFKDCHPQGINVKSFKKPTEEEFAHDFLWRVHKEAPAKGMIHIWNRSHYEDVLIQRVHKWIDEETVDKRYESINAFEKLLQYGANTILFKFYLHLSYDQQAIELQQRINEHDKHWKHNSNDWREREHWELYMDAYEDMLFRSEVPWHIIPVDKRWYRDYLVSKTMVETLETLDLQYPPLEED
jgi:PPK2 family polyphosphate:nucleotide phosphotransferase